MKVAIIDDEMLVRVGIRSMLDWEAHGCEVLWEARSGEEALRKFGRERPDLVLLDLTMPGLGGLEVLREIRRLDESVIVIVVSCHEEFSMVKEAMKSGASDYLLKASLDRETLLDTLREYPSAGTEKAEAPAAEAYLPDKELFRFIDSGGAAGLSDELRRHFPFLCIMMAVIPEFDSIKERYAGKEEGFVQKLVKDMTEKVIHTPARCVLPYREACFYILIGDDKPYSNLQLLDMGKRLRTTLKRFLNLEAAVGISRMRDEEERFGLCLREAQEACGWQYFDRECRCYLYCPYESRPVQRAFITEVEELSAGLKQAVAAEREEEARSLLETYCDRFAGFREVGPEYFKRIIQLVLGDIYTLPLEEIQSLAQEINRTERMIQTVDIFMRGFLQNRGRTLPQIKSDNYLVKRTAAYLRENYAGQITLKTLSEYLYVSEGYISRLFKAETGMNLFRYLNLIRIEKAKKLLRDHTLKPYQISDMVGFQTRVYFDNVFKSLEGITPSEYRKRYL